MGILNFGQNLCGSSVFLFSHLVQREIIFSIMKIERRKDEKQFFCFTWPAVLSQQHLELSIQRGYSMTTVGNYPQHFWAFFTGRHDIHSCNKMRVKSTILLTFEQGCGTPRRQHGNCLNASMYWETTLSKFGLNVGPGHKINKRLIFSSNRQEDPSGPLAMALF